MGIKILLADDSLTAQNMGKKILSEAGHEVITVSNGAAAAKKIAELKPQLVLLDVFMPGYTGLELCEKLRNATATAKLPVLLTVGKMEPYSPQEGARVKADGVIIKPFEASDLTAAVERLVQKLAPAPSLSAEDAPKENRPAAFKDESYPASKQDASAQSEYVVSAGTAKAPSKAYEETMRLDASQIAAILNPPDRSEQQAGPPEPVHAAEFSVAAPAHAPEEFSVSSPAMAASEPSAAFESELAPSGSEVPSYMAQYLADQPDDRAPAPTTSVPSPIAETETGTPVSETVFAADAPYSSQDAPTVVLPKHAVAQHFDTPMAFEAPVSSAEGLELTAAAPVPDLPIVREVGLEPTQHTFDGPTVMLPDPALVTDPHRSTMDFVTQFGAQESGLAEQLLQSMGSATGEKVSEDDFESRLNAAMNAFEAPSADLPTAESALPTPLLKAAIASPIAEVTAEPAALPITAEPEVVEVQPTISAVSEPVVEELVPAAPPQAAEAALEAESPVVFAEPHEIYAGVTSPAHNEVLVAPEGTSESPTPTITSQFGDAEAELQEGSAPLNAVSSMLVSQPESSASGASMEASAPPEMDDSVIHQVRESFSNLPVDHLGDHSGAEPQHGERQPEAMAMAAAAAAAPAAVPPTIAHEAELEITRALTAAVGAETPSDVASATVPADAAASDANSVASAVENVMRRELPNLVWKIMAELDQRKR